MATDTTTRPKPVLIKTIFHKGKWEGELWQEGEKENESFILSWGFKLRRDHAARGSANWSNLREKESGENHSGPFHLLCKVFSGQISLDDFYTKFED